MQIITKQSSDGSKAKTTAPTEDEKLQESAETTARAVPQANTCQRLTRGSERKEKLNSGSAAKVEQPVRQVKAAVGEKRKRARDEKEQPADVQTAGE